jgi:hypothetical protein
MSPLLQAALISEPVTIANIAHVTKVIANEILLELFGRPFVYFISLQL